MHYLSSHSYLAELLVEVMGGHAFILGAATSQLLLVPAQQDESGHQVGGHVISVREQRVQGQRHLLHGCRPRPVPTALFAAEEAAYLPEDPPVPVM